MEIHSLQRPLHSKFDCRESLCHIELDLEEDSIHYYWEPVSYLKKREDRQVLDEMAAQAGIAVVEVPQVVVVHHHLFQDIQTEKILQKDWGKDCRIDFLGMD